MAQVEVDLGLYFCVSSLYLLCAELTMLYFVCECLLSKAKAGNRASKPLGLLAT